jgi:hypothetical protein
MSAVIMTIKVYKFQKCNQKPEIKEKQDNIMAKKEKQTI